MTPDEMAKKMRAITENPDGDQETDHEECDALMCAVLRELGFGAAVDIFESSHRWYA